MSLLLQLILAPLAHLVGDYVLQTDAMATRKTSRSLWCLAHVITYALPFLVLRPSPAALAVIVGTHYVIDRYRLARFVIAAKNSLTDWGRRGDFFASPTGYIQEMTHSAYLTHSGTIALVGTTDTVLVPGNFLQLDLTIERGTPAWMAVWLLIIADNTMHLVINAAALLLLP